ncbi:hypothetical protein EV1_038404 [Malus domestica]
MIQLFCDAEQFWRMRLLFQVGSKFGLKSPITDSNCFFTVIVKQGSEQERAYQDEDASGKPYNEGGSSWDFVNRLSQLKAVDIFYTALPERPRGWRSFVNMSCAEKKDLVRLHSLFTVSPQKLGFQEKDEAPNRSRVRVTGIAPVRLFVETLNVWSVVWFRGGTGPLNVCPVNSRIHRKNCTAVALEENGRAPCKSALNLKATRARASGGSDGCVPEGL